MKASTRAVFWMAVALIVLLILLALYFSIGKKLIVDLTWEKLLLS